MESNAINVLLKSQLKKAKSNRELCQWYVQVIYYHAFCVPLLLRLSNDVEENPGPRTINDIVDPTYTETQNDADDETISNIPDDQWSGDEAEILAGTTDSMLTTSDFVSDNEKQRNI